MVFNMGVKKYSHVEHHSHHPNIADEHRICSCTKGLMPVSYVSQVGWKNRKWPISHVKSTSIIYLR